MNSSMPSTRVGGATRQQGQRLGIHHQRADDFGLTPGSTIHAFVYGFRNRLVDFFVEAVSAAPASVMLENITRGGSPQYLTSFQFPGLFATSIFLIQIDCEASNLHGDHVRSCTSSRRTFNVATVADIYFLLRQSGAGPWNRNIPPDPSEPPYVLVCYYLTSTPIMYVMTYYFPGNNFGSDGGDRKSAVARGLYVAVWGALFQHAGSSGSRICG